MEDNDTFHLFYHIIDTNHIICKVSLKSNKASKYTFQNGALSRNNYFKNYVYLTTTSNVFYTHTCDRGQCRTVPINGLSANI